jgi:hypothetical protein
VELLHRHLVQLCLEGWGRLLGQVVQLMGVLIEVVHLYEQVGAVRGIVVIPATSQREA